MKRFLPLAVIILFMAIVYLSGVYQYLSFETLKKNHTALKAFVAVHPFSMPVLFMLVYVVVTALSLPGGLVLSLFGGYLFAQPFSTLYVVFAATCGATIIFCVAKTALGNSLRERAGPFLKKVERGFQKNPANYLLFLRLVPLFPFWVVNIVPAFFGVSVRTFVWTTFVGIIPGAFVFTYTGAGLEQIFESGDEFSIASVFNTQIKIALFLLGVLALMPIIIKKMRKAS